MSDVVERARTALKYAPELPWLVQNDHDPMTGVTTYWIEDVERFRGLRNNLYCGTDVHLAEFIAASRSLVPELVTEVERLRALISADKETDDAAEIRRLTGEYNAAVANGHALRARQIDRVIRALERKQ